MGASDQEEDRAPSLSKHKTSKEVYFSVLPDKYEPLIEEVEEETPEEKKKRKQRQKEKKKKKYKKYRKNVGKALRFSWRCLLAGLQSMTAACYAPPSTVATAFTGVWPHGGSSKA